MRRATKTTLVLIALAALCLGALSAAAVAVKKVKRQTVVSFFVNSPKFNPGGEVKASGALSTVTPCKTPRVVKLQVLGANGVVIATIDTGGSTGTSGNLGNWRLSGHLPNNLPAGTNSVRVKATKTTTRKYLCKAGVSPSVPIPQ